MIDLKDLTFEEVKGIGEGIDGFKPDKRWGEKAYRENLELYLSANPDVLKPEESQTSESNESPKLPEGDVNPTPEPEKDKTLSDEGPKPSEADKIKIKSVYKGVISSSAGTVDFGDNGEAEVTPEQADIFLTLKGYDKC